MSGSNSQWRMDVDTGGGVHLGGEFGRSLLTSDSNVIRLCNEDSWGGDMAEQLDRRVAVVNGAGSGIGAASVAGLTEAGVAGHHVAAVVRDSTRLPAEGTVAL